MRYVASALRSWSSQGLGPTVDTWLHQAGGHQSWAPVPLCLFFRAGPCLGGMAGLSPHSLLTVSLMLTCFNKVVMADAGETPTSEAEHCRKERFPVCKGLLPSVPYLSKYLRKARGVFLSWSQVGQRWFSATTLVLRSGSGIGPNSERFCF